MRQVSLRFLTVSLLILMPHTKLAAFASMKQITDPSAAIRLCERFSPPSAGAKIAACIADLADSGGMADATGIVGDQNISVDPFIGITKPVVLKLGAAKYLIDTNIVVPPNVTIFFAEGSVLDIKAGVSLEIRGAIDARPSQIFTGAGSIRIASSKIDRLVANWFAGAPDLGAQINAAVNALPERGGIIEASDLSGARTINSSINVVKPIVLLFGSGVFQVRTTPMFAFSPAASVAVRGAGRVHTVIEYVPSTGTALSFSNLRSPELRDVTISTSAVPNSATGVAIDGSEHTIIQNVAITGFQTNLSITGSGSARSFDTRVIDSEITNCSSTCITIDHAVDTYLTNVLNWTVRNNPTRAWAVTIDTGASGTYIQSMSILNAGFRIRNSAPSGSSRDMPPEFVFADQLIVDSVAETDSILFDASLDIPDALGRKGKSYHFTNSWSSFTQTDGKVGILISGGEDISFTDFRIRLNRYHGVHIRGGRDVRFAHGVIIGNNQQNATDGDGIRIASSVSGWRFSDVRVGNFVAGESGHQKYGIRIEPGSSTSWSLTSIDATGNSVGGLSDNSVGVNKTKWDVRDYDRGDALAIDSLHGAKRRLELGDDSFFLDYRASDPDSVTFSWAANAYFRYNRSSKTAAWVIDGVEKLRLSPSGLSVGAGAQVLKVDSMMSTQDFRSVNANNCIDSPPIRFVGARPGDTLIVTAPTAFLNATCGAVASCLHVSGYINAMDQVKIRACNVSGQNAVKLPVEAFRLQLIKH